MSTATTLTDMDIKPTAVTYGAFTVQETVTDDKGNTSTKTVIKPTVNEKQLAKAKTEGNFLMEQSFTYDVPGTLNGIVEFDMPEDEKVNLFRQALTAKAGRAIVSLMSELDEAGNAVFQPVEGHYDLRSDLKEVSGRRGLTDTEKALKTLSSLKNLPGGKELIEQFLAQLQG